MTIIFLTAIEARQQATRLRRIHAGTDWRVRIQKPLFDGDSWRVVVS